MLAFINPIATLLDYPNHKWYVGMMFVTVAQDAFQAIPFAYLRYKHRPYKLNVDLEKKIITDQYGLKIAFEIDDFRRDCLMNGWDDVGLTLRFEDKILDYEKKHGIV